MKKIIVSSSATFSLLFLSPNLVDAEENVINQEVINETERKLNNVLTNEAAVENKDTAQNTAKGTSNINDKVEENESALEERSPTGSKEAIADLEEPTSTESEEAIADLEEPTPDESEEAVADLEEPTPTESEEIVADSGELTSTESEEAVEESKQVETEEIVVVTEEAAAHDQSLDEKLDEAKDDEKHVIQEENGNDSLKENQKISRLSLFAVLDTKSMNLTDEKAEELVENLNRLGFSDGSKLDKKIKELQEYYGLDVTGKVNKETLQKIDEILNHPLQKGNYVDEVIPYKDMLNRIGYDGIAVTNNFGSFTEKRVKQFQRDYKLPASGIIEDITASKIKSVFESIFQQGSKHESVRKLKQNLNRLGFDGLADANTYGSFTTKRVKQFQAYYGLKVTGKADLATLNKIDEILNHPLQKGKHHPETIRLKKALNALGYNGLAITTNFGSFTEKRVKQFQADHDLPVSGIAEKNTLDTLYELLDSRTFTQYNITLHDALAIQMKVNPQTDKHYAYVSKKYVKNGQVTASALNVRSGPGTKKSKIGMLYNGDKVKILGEHNGWYRKEFRSSAWKDAAPEDVKYYLDPSNFINDDRLVFQFLDLSKPSNTSASVLNRYLEGKGILDGMGQAFIDASKKHGVNDLYLLSHALLETGNGSSTLANGVKVNGKTVYNMFGIGANDGCAIQCGAQRAYKEGWFTPYDAIVGGARFIGNSYIKKGQNTLYKMRWNPEGMEKYGYATHQYATDIGWAAKQVTSMYNMYKNIGITNLILDIPRYL